MFILIALIIAAAIGTALHFAVPHRSTRGVALGTLLATALAAVVWTSLTWAGFAEDNVWLWLASVILPAVVTWAALVVLARSRTAHDENEKARLRLS